MRTRLSPPFKRVSGSVNDGEGVGGGLWSLWTWMSLAGTSSDHWHLGLGSVFRANMGMDGGLKMVL